MRRWPLRRTKLGIDLPSREKKRKIFSLETLEERIIRLISCHDTPGIDSPRTSATHTLIIAQTSDLVLQACGLGSAHSPDQFSPIQQSRPTPRGRGRTPQVGWTQLWGSLRLGCPRGACTRLRIGVACSACTQSARLPLSGSHAMAWSNDSEPC
jgi:hypothetical protein